MISKSQCRKSRGILPELRGIVRKCIEDKKRKS